jgi:hypothetical protein
MSIKQTAGRLLTAVDAAHWFIENVNEEDPNREHRWRALRELLSEAQTLAEINKIEADGHGYEIVMAQDSSPWTVMLMPPDTIRPHCTEPFLCHVMAANQSAAFDAAIKAANREFMIGEAEAAELLPSDWRLLLMTTGHIVNRIEG